MSLWFPGTPGTPRHLRVRKRPAFEAQLTPSPLDMTHPGGQVAVRAGDASDAPRGIPGQVPQGVRGVHGHGLHGALHGVAAALGVVPSSP